MLAAVCCLLTGVSDTCSHEHQHASTFHKVQLCFIQTHQGCHEGVHSYMTASREQSAELKALPLDQKAF